MQTEILKSLKNKELTSNEIADKLGISIELVYRACAKLYKFGFIRKRRVPNKNRKNISQNKWSL